MYETSTIKNVAYTCFKQQLHDEMNDAHIYENENAICGSQTPGVLQGPPTSDAHQGADRGLEFLLKCTGENAHKNYDIVLPWKQAAWPDIWNGFVHGVIIPYLKSRLGNVRNKPPPGGMAIADARVDHLLRWASEISPQ
jgi:hypothetical protein